MSFRIKVPDGVENEAKYIAAAEARIRANAWKGKFDRWLKIEGAQRINEFLHQFGEFDHIRDEDGQFKAVHPVVKASFGSFFDKMRDALANYGSLTEKQHAAVLAMIERAEQRVAERAEKRAADAAASQWVGTVGDRIEITATIVFVTSYETQFGVTVVTGLRDDAGNMLIQKGVGIGYKGEKIVVRATVKEHSVRDGMKQTILSRPKLLDIINTEEEA